LTGSFLISFSKAVRLKDPRSQITKRRKNAASIGLHIGLALVLIAGRVALYPFLKVGRCQAGCPGTTDDRQRL